MENFKILDGGTSMELSRIDNSLNLIDSLWSARVLLTNPSYFVECHKNFIKAGSQIVLTGSYQASIEGFVQHAGLSEEQAYNTIKLSVKLARQAAQETGNTAEIAGSVGAYGAMLHDGSEYTGDYIDRITVEQLKDHYRPRIKALVEEKPDYIALETMPSLVEAKAVVDMLAEEFPGVKVWVSYQCKNETQTGHGELFSDAVKAVSSCDNVVAVGMNCTKPRIISPLLKSIQHLKLEKAILVKPNSGEDHNEEGWYGRPESSPLAPEWVKEWIELGARWIGGCCQIFSPDIANLVETVKTIVEKVDNQDT